MKIGINALLRWGHTGVGNYVANLVSSLGEIDQDNEYFIFVHDDGGEYISARHRNFRFIECNVNIDNPVRSRLWEQTHLPRIAKHYSLDVMHSPINILPVFISCPSVLTIHDTLHFQHPASVSFWRRNYNKLLIQASTKKADAILTVSEVVKNEIHTLLAKPKNAIRVTHLGVDSSFRVLEDHDAIEEVKRHYNISFPYVLFIGYPHSRKNIPRLVSAFSLIQGRLPERCLLVIAGDTSRNVESDTANIRAAVDHLKLWDRIILTGHVPQEMMPSLINGARILAFPSIYEGFGLPALEAMACGIPVLCSNVPALQEVVGRAGLLVNPFSVDEIAEGLYRALTDRDLRGNMVRMGLERAKMFSWIDTARRTLECYQEVSQNRK